MPHTKPSDSGTFSSRRLLMSRPHSDVFDVTHANAMRGISRVHATKPLSAISVANATCVAALLVAALSDARPSVTR
jgi:hypothetical protein